MDSWYADRLVLFNETPDVAFRTELGYLNPGMIRYGTGHLTSEDFHDSEAIPPSFSPRTPSHVEDAPRPCLATDPEGHLGPLAGQASPDDPTRNLES
jgi:hypothetical protein